MLPDVLATPKPGALVWPDKHRSFRKAHNGLLIGQWMKHSPSRFGAPKNEGRNFAKKYLQFLLVLF